MSPNGEVDTYSCDAFFFAVTFVSV